MGGEFAILVDGDLFARPTSLALALHKYTFFYIFPFPHVLEHGGDSVEICERGIPLVRRGGGH